MKGSRGWFVVLLLIFATLFLSNHWAEDLWNDRRFVALPKDAKKCSCTTSSTTLWLPKFSERSYDSHKAEWCPFYFKWIISDLWPWQKSGITLNMVEEAKKMASFRLMIVKGRLFVELYKNCFQTRDVFTIWGFSQLIKLYPGMVPDLDLMFNCEDKPAIRKDMYIDHRTPPPPLFHYCGSNDTYDIVFPDWSFWGWPEIQIPPWQALVKEIQKGNKQVKWEDRGPTAYWRGNPLVSPEREDLFKCSNTPNWNGSLYTQNWRNISKDAKLSNQCNHRYKIYIEGNAWSVSLKYIMACDSPTLMITPYYYDFFLRGLLPTHHYWPITPHNKCNSINFAVKWGNNHTKNATAIGEAGSNFMSNELKMKNVYDYMFHALREYSKLLKYKPSVTKNAVEFCPHSILCSTNEIEKVYMKDSMVTSSSPSPPCKLGKADARAIQNFLKVKVKSMELVGEMEHTEQ